MYPSCSSFITDWHSHYSECQNHQLYFYSASYNQTVSKQLHSDKQENNRIKLHQIKQIQNVCDSLRRRFCSRYATHGLCSCGRPFICRRHRRARRPKTPWRSTWALRHKERSSPHALSTGDRADSFHSVAGSGAWNASQLHLAAYCFAESLFGQVPTNFPESNIVMRFFLYNQVSAHLLPVNYSLQDFLLI